MQHTYKTFYPFGYLKKDQTLRQKNKINEPELRTYFEEFFRSMRTRWHFRNEPTPEFSETAVISLKSTWKPPMGHPNVEVFLSQIEQKNFKEVQSPLGYSNQDI